MSFWILDTDHASLFLAGNKSIITQVAKHSNDVAITVITVQELFNGWAGKLNDPTQQSNLVHLYTKLWKTTEFFKVITVLNFEEDAENTYQALRQNKALAKKRIEKDLRIASIALAQNATIVTRNYKDFSQIPNLNIENWQD
ncbi:type II toxin-antitoxin system VapC family toxin [Plectonema cf. radiosum LEGE 06105]|uniref:Type II toxin-antitoxin system VapC family toxin n=1 Tax=Plectonema cf. radiosum LEGE 06105 TaxID=945769 RepID=A0A8J7F768_9CYAN|nr:type II toxin-antitoxin system VapC family toxin [Plectonema radiosum]MBE9216705.1 type II toxin-antitoxin system VapC family toxin [Plectonema cf. radiosum LEGE 06105]